MSTFDDASLVFIPSGYKTSKAYSVKPIDGTGDLTFTRSNDTATRVASNGLIEKVRTNLVLQSVWPSIGTGVAPTSWVVGTGPATSFSAGPLAGQLLCNTSASRGFIQQTVSLTAGQYALSVFVDSVTTTNSVADLVLIFGSTNRKYYEDGVEVNLNTNVVAGKRYAMVGTVTTGSFGMRIGSGVNANATANYVISRPQLEVSDFGATPYVATTTAAVSVGPVANVPRLDYLNSSCPRLLLEPQRTNLCLWSESFNNAAWGSAGITITANQAVSPDGNTNADLAVNSSSVNYLFQSLGGFSSGTYTASIFAKKGSQSSFAFGFVAGGFTGGMGVKFNFDTQTFSTPVNYGNFTSISASYQSYGNGWYRLNLTGTTATSTTYFFVLGSLQESFAVNAYVYGAQLEAASYATSYIQTLGASVTRGADACSKTGISSLIGQTQGTLFVEFEVTHEMTGNNPLYTLSDGTTNNNIYANLFVSGGSNRVEFFVNNGGLAQVTANVLISNGSHKLAFAYKENDFIAFIDGVQVLVDTSGTVPATSRYGLGSWVNNALMYSDRIAQALLFKTRLTNAQLAELTTL